jgi:hypothetical protein
LARPNLGIEKSETRMAAVEMMSTDPSAFAAMRVPASAVSAIAATIS